jgi:hypothetical protein
LLTGFEDPVAQHFVKWLHQMTGCRFAQRFVKATATTDAERSPRIVCATIEIGEDAASRFSEFLDGCAGIEAAGVGLFPSIASTEQIARLVRALGEHERWRFGCRIDEQRRLLLLSVEWKTLQGKWSSAMGFAPLMTMPITRRAPYVALAMWPGAARKANQDVVGFIDMPSHFDDHKKLLGESKAAVEALLGEDPEHAPWRSTAFALGTDLLALFGPPAAD